MSKPSVVTEPLDFTGLHAYSRPLLSRQASSWTTLRYTLNVIDSTDPYTPGLPLLVPDPDALDRLRLRPGAEVSLSARTAGPQWRGKAATFLTGSPLASGNLPATAFPAGLLRPEKFRHFSRSHIQAGGPLGRRTGLFLSATGQWSAQQVPADPDGQLLRGRFLSATARLHHKLGPRDQLDTVLTGSRIDLSGFGVPAGLEALLGRRSAPPFRVSAGLEEKDHLDLVQFGWTRDSASSPAFQLRYGYSVAHLDTAPASPPVAPPVIGLLDGSVVGPPPLGNLAIRTAHNFASTIRPQPLAAARTHHRLGAALSFRQALARNRFSAPFDLHRITFADRPSTLLQLNTPLDSRANVASLLMNASHAARWTGWFSTNVALAADLSRGWLPAQSSPSGAFAPARRFPERRGLISWHSFEPAFSFALTPPTFRRLTLRASLARRHYPLAARYLDYANRNSLSGTEFQWTAAGPGLLLRRFGGQYSSIDPSLRRPYVNQVDLVASCRIPAGLAARLTLFRHDTRNRLAALASGPAYSLRTIHDPGGDFIQGTPDDQLLPVYEQIRDTFGSDRFLLTNTGHGAFSKGLIAELRGRHGSLSWRLSFVAEKAFGITGPGNGPSDNDPGVVGSLLSDPNSLLNAAGRAFFDRAYIAKLSASYQAPARFGRFELGTVVNYFDGLPFARKLFIPDLAQGPFYVLATPRGSPEGGHRTQYHLAWDLRVARSFSLRRGSLRLLADLFNLPNLGNNLRENDLSGPLFEQRLPLAVQPPRHARFAVEYAF